MTVLNQLIGMRIERVKMIAFTCPELGPIGKVADKFVIICPINGGDEDARSGKEEADDCD